MPYDAEADAKGCYDDAIAEIGRRDRAAAQIRVTWYCLLSGWLVHIRERQGWRLYRLIEPTR